MNILVTYDVNTETKAGRRRLARVAKACKNYGQRVQLSVFECQIDERQYDELLSKLRRILKEDTDSLRVYRLHGARDAYLETYGVDTYVDFEDTLIV